MMEKKKKTVCRMVGWPIVGWPGIWVIAALILPTAHLILASKDCTLPEDWAGSWFLKGVGERIEVTGVTFGTLGLCTENIDDNKYILYDRAEECFRCLHIWPRHTNAIQFRSSECIEGLHDLEQNKLEPVDGLCESFSEEPMETLVRLEGPDVPCPFHGAFTFTYKEGATKECMKRSTVSECVNPTQNLLTFEPCTETKETMDNGILLDQLIINFDGDLQETLTCKATWKDNGDVGANQTFMVGTIDFRYRRTDEERVRCFLIQETRREIKVSQSSDATCYTDLYSPTNGFRTMKLKRVEKKADSCHFPSWVTDIGRYVSFNYASLYQFNQDSLSVSNYSLSNMEIHQLSRTTCVHINDTGENYVKMVASTIASCEQRHKCLKLTKRTDHIIEIQEGIPVPTDSDTTACEEVYFRDKKTKFTTLIQEGLKQNPCPINGFHNVTGLYLKGMTEPCDKHGFSEVHIKCSEEYLIDFSKMCPSLSKVGLREVLYEFHGSYVCLGGWEEEIQIKDLHNPYTENQDMYQYSYASLDNFRYVSDSSSDSESLFEEDFENLTLGYVIVRPQNESRAHQRICFIYTAVNGTYSWTVDSTACLRKIRPGHEGRQRFNTSLLETCGSSLNKAFPSVIIILILSHNYIIMSHSYLNRL